MWFEGKVLQEWINFNNEASRISILLNFEKNLETPILTETLGISVVHYSGFQWKKEKRKLISL